MKKKNFFSNTAETTREGINRKEEENGKNRKFWIVTIVSALTTLFIGHSAGYAKGQESLEGKLEQQEQSLVEVTEKNNTLQTERDTLQENFNILDTDYETMNLEYTQYKERMEPYEEMEVAEAEAKKVEAEKQIAEEKERQKAEEEKKKAEEEQRRTEEAAQKEAEEKQGYETGITYNQLARTPDDYIGKKVKFSGKVVQVIEGDGSVTIRFAVNDDYDTIIIGDYNSSIVASRILEDDYITIYGTSFGLYTYEATMGHEITIPGLSIEKIDH